MLRFIAFLRAINVGGGRTIKMASLRQVFESLGFSEVTTFIASGNVVFESTTKNTGALEKKIKRRLREILGYPVATFVRTDTELAEIADYNPFRQSERDAADELNIVFLANPLDAKSKQKVTALGTDTDKFRVHGREIYWLRRKKRDAIFSTVPLGQTLSAPFTIRSSKTIKKIAVKYCSSKS